MENLESNQPVESLISINNEIKHYLIETSKWAKFLSILGYIGVGFLILGGIVASIGLSIFSSISDFGFPMALVGLVYIVLGVLYYFPVSYLHKFSVQVKNGLTSNNQEAVNTGFENLKSLFKFMGIFMIVVLSIYVLALVLVLPMTLLFLK